MGIRKTLLLHALALLAILAGSLSALAQTCENIVIPAYFYPNQPHSLWNTAVDNAPLPDGRSQILIMNPNNGPDQIFDRNYLEATTKVHAAGRGFLVYGYVYTRYGKRSLTRVKRDIDKYYDWYKVDGIFVDETASSADLASTYYQSLATYISSKRSGAGVLFNPGVYPDQAYLNISVPPNSSLVVNVFEGAYKDYVNATIPAWAFSYPSNRFSHLVYSTKSVLVSKTVALSAQRNVGWVYVTDLGLPNPWLALPSYWSNMTARVKDGC
jgi:Spherulation-specific family 4